MLGKKKLVRSIWVLEYKLPLHRDWLVSEGKQRPELLKPISENLKRVELDTKTRIVLYKATKKVLNNLL